MISARTPPGGAREPGRDQRARWWTAAALAVVVVLIGALLLPTVWSATSGDLDPTPQPSPPASTVPSASAAPSVPPSTAADVLALPGRVPANGTGRFGYAPGRSEVFGTAGTLRRYRVAVEGGSGERAGAFAAVVEATLGDSRSWTGQGKIRLQRVPGNAAASFTVYLASRATAGRMCVNGGVNITVAGRPYTSCRTPGRAIINLDRWRRSARPYLAARVPLAVYRQYVINHEVGHELGNHHEGCPERGGPAPVMVQQTLTLRGCVPYAWPRRSGRMLRGPAL